MFAWLVLIACGPPEGAPFGGSRAHQGADTLVFNNGTEPEYLDPSQATGHPDGRIIGELFDGLTEYHPKDLSPQPGHATGWTVHPDGKGYTFALRPEARWTDGQPVTAWDYVWSWERLLNPIYLGRYGSQLYAVQGARDYNLGRLHRLAVAVDGVPAGARVRVIAAEGPGIEAGQVPTIGERRLTQAVPLLDRWGHTRARLAVDDAVVWVGQGETAGTTWVWSGAADAWGSVPTAALSEPRAGKVRLQVEVLAEVDFPFEAYQGEEAGLDTAGPASVVFEPPAPTPGIGRTLQVDIGQVQPAADVVGFRATDDHTLEVRLEGVAPYFLQQTSHTALKAVPRWTIERHGMRWTRPENMVSSGPFTLEVHEVRDRFEMERDPNHWDAEHVRLERIIAYSVDNLTTSANLYRAGYTDFITAGDIPSEFLPMLEGRPDFRINPALTTYFYRVNTTRPPLDDPRVRRALVMAIDKRDVVKIARGGELVASHIVPPGMPGYPEVEGLGFDPAAARALLAEAGYPGGEGFPEIKVLYNTQEKHKLIAAVIQAQWAEHLGIQIQLENREWKTYLKAVHALDYDLARGGWIGDYQDPNTFLEMWVSGGGNNETGWADPEFDALIRDAAREPDPAQRLVLLGQAEAILNDQVPFLPMYWYTWSELMQPDVRGHHPNLLDHHPMRHMWLDR